MATLVYTHCINVFLTPMLPLLFLVLCTPNYYLSSPAPSVLSISSMRLCTHSRDNPLILECAGSEVLEWTAHFLCARLPLHPRKLHARIHTLMWMW